MQKSVAALADVELAARIRQARDSFDQLRGRLSAAFADVRIEKGEAEIDSVVGEIRRR